MKKRANHNLAFEPVRKILKQDGCKVQKGAVEELRNILEDLSDEIRKCSQKLAIEQGRKTISQEDVSKAWEITQLNYFINLKGGLDE